MSKKPYEKPVLRVFGSVSELTRGFGASAVEPFFGRRGMFSDARLKHNIVEIGRHPLGFGLYLYNYMPELHGELGGARQFGVMAQEVEAIVPEAVTIGADGFRRVNYSILSIRLAS